MGNICYEMLPVDKIELDIRNPRIAKWVEMYGDNIKAEDMALALGAGSGDVGDKQGPTFNSLRQSIETNGGVIYPIIVNKEATGRLVVIEGNTRTLIYKEFKKNNVRGNWESIPAMVYENMPEETIDAIRLQAHLVGTREWDPYSKARYLDFLRDKKHLPFSQIVDFCGGAKREVENYIQAFRDMETYYRPILDSDQDFDASRFSAFVELQSSRVVEGLSLAGFSKTDFAKWVHDRKIYPLMRVRDLPRILQNPKSKEIFLKSNAQEAVKALDVPSPAAALSESSLEQLARELCKRINSMQYSDIQRLRTVESNEEKDIICAAKDALGELCADIFK